MELNLLLVEDNHHKRERVLGYLQENFSKWKVVEAQSFASGSKRVSEQDFQVIVMDMSLPTYDKSSSESGGRFRTFGGWEIARKVLRKNGTTAILFLTQYEAFSEKGNSHTLETLDDKLRAECGEFYLGLVHYDSSQSAWKDKIAKALLKVSNEDFNS